MRSLIRITLVCLGFAVISPAAAVDFDIVINYVPGSNFTPSQKAAFAQAEATWESLITSYKPNFAGNPTLTINADNPPLDGVGGTLGQAGPTNGFTVGPYLYASAGIMSFDSADVAALETAGTWEAVILHEMGHVIGIGTLWSSSGVGLPGYQELYVDGTGQYTGATGLAAYQQEFVGQQSATFVPVELGGGGGTANGHWNEGDGGFATGITRVSDGKDMNLMLMSGWLNPGSFISDTTLGSFEDMGYNTTFAQSETLTVAIADASISENGGSTTATVTRSGDTTSSLVVDLASDDTGEATVPSSVTIAAGQSTSPAFAITAVDDALSDGTQTVSITASVAAGGYTDGSDSLEVSDDEPAPAFAEYVDFGTSSSPVAAGYTGVTAAQWTSSLSQGNNERATGSDLERDFVWVQDGSYTLSGVPAGTYDVTVYLGDVDASKPARDDNDVYLQGILVDEGLDTPSGSVLARSYSGIVVEGNGTLTLRLVGLGGSTDIVLVMGMDVVASGSAPETLTVAIADASISENGGSTTATVTRSGDTSSSLVVDLASDDTGEATVPSSVTIAAGQSTSPAFAITAVDDALSDGTQTVSITASVAAGGYTDGSDSLEVSDDEPAPAFAEYVDFGTSSSPVAAGYTGVTAAQWTSSLSQGNNERATGSDLERDFVWVQDGSYTLSGVPAGTYDVTVYLGDVDASKPARDDNDVYLQGILVDEGLDTPSGSVLARSYSGIVVEGNGTLTLRLVGLGGSTDIVLVMGMDVVASGSAPETLTVAIADASISENGGSTTATVTRSGDTSSSLVVNLASDDTGEATVPSSVTIAAGQSTSPAFAITAVDDALSDGTQTVSITASVAAGGYTDGSDSLEVSDDEPAPAFAEYVDFGTSSSPVAAGYTGVTAAQWTSSLSQGNNERATGSDLERDFVWVQDGSYTLSGVPAGTYDVTVYLGDVDASKPARDDNDVYLQGILVDEGLDTPSGSVLARSYSGIVVEGNGTLTLRLVGLGGSTDIVLIMGMDVVASGSAPETLGVAIADASISENGGSTTATVTRSGDTTSSLVVDLASDDTGEATVPSSVTIAAGQSTSLAFAITAVDDALSDGTQTVSITASVAAGGYTDGSDSLEVSDDEPAPAFAEYVDFGTSSSPVAAGYTGVTAAQWTSSLSQGNNERATGSDLERDFVWVQDGSYTLSGVPAGTYDVTVYLGDVDASKPARDDNDVYLQGILVDEGLDTPSGSVLARSYSGIVVEGNGTLTLRLVGLGGSTDIVLVMGMDVVASGSAPETLTVAIADASISENGGSTTATVTRSGDTSSSLVVDLASDDTGEATVPSSVTIAAGQSTSPAFAITAVDDALSDGTQTVSITASVAAGGYTDGSDSLEVSDDEPAPAFAEYVDFGTSSSPVAAGYTGVTAAQWTSSLSQGNNERATGSDLERDFVWVQDGSYTLSGVPAGTYDVTVYLGDVDASKPARDDNDVYLQGILVDEGLDTPSGSVLARSYSGIVVEGNGTLTLRLVGLGGSTDIVLVMGMDVVAANPSLAAPESSIESSLTESSATTTNDSYQLASGGLGSGAVDSSDDAEPINTDGDGVADAEDVFPDDADFAGLSDYVDFIIDYVVDDRVIFDEDWKELQNEADFVAGLEGVLELVVAAEQAQDPEWAALLYMEALGIVENELLIRTDGFHGGSFEDDWMIVEEAQDILHADLDSLREYLWLIAP